MHCAWPDSGSVQFSLVSRPERQRRNSKEGAVRRNTVRHTAEADILVVFEGAIAS